MSEIIGLWIPLEYLRNTRLSRNELVIISYLKYRIDQGVFKGNQSEISQALNLKSQRVSEAMISLAQKGFLQKTPDQKLYIISEKYLGIDTDKITESVKIKESLKITESVKQNHGKRENKITESVNHTYIEKDNKKENNDKVENFQKSNDLIIKKSTKSSAKKIALPEIEFLDSEFKDFKVFEEYLSTAHPDIDSSFYYYKIAGWIDKNTGQLAKRKIWKSTVQQFLENDYKRGELVTTKSKGHGKSSPNNFKQTNIFEQRATTEQLDSLIDQYFASQ